MGPDGEDVSRAMLGAGRSCCQQGVRGTVLGGLVRQETEGTLHFSAGVTDTPAGILPAFPPTLLLKEFSPGPDHPCGLSSLPGLGHTGSWAAAMRSLHLRVSPNIGATEPEAPDICCLPSHRPQLGVRRQGCGSGLAKPWQVPLVSFVFSFFLFDL